MQPLWDRNLLLFSSVLMSISNLLSIRDALVISKLFSILSYIRATFFRKSDLGWTGLINKITGTQ